MITPSKSARVSLSLVALAGLAAVLVPTAFAQVSGSSGGPTSPYPGSGLGFSMIFTAFLVMLGPAKVIGPFARLTAGMSEADLRKTATKAFGFSCVGGLVAAILGQSMLLSWGISFSVLHFTAGLVLLLVALRTVMEQYDPAGGSPVPAAPPRNVALAPLAFPTILTPHGIAIFILLLAITEDAFREANIIGLFLGVMALNWIVMLFARSIVRYGATALAMLGAVLGVLQVALAVQLMVGALRALHVLPPA